MRKNRKAVRAWFAGTAAVVLAAPALAEDSLGDSVEQFLADTERAVADAKVWKVQLKPSLRESLIWTDNVYMNDDDEDNVYLTAVLRGGGNYVTDPDRLQRIEDNRPEFDPTEGRQEDFLLQSQLDLDFVLPINEEASKFFETPDMRILGVQVRNQEYFHVNELDNSSIFLTSDIFAFLSDLMSFEGGNAFWVRVRDDFAHLRDPLDAEIRQLRSDGLATLDSFNDFGRLENTAVLDLGWRGAQVDAMAGYENYHLLLDDESLDQAEHTRHNFHSEVGGMVPGLAEKRAYVRYDVWLYRFAQAPLYGGNGEVVDSAQILNDAFVQRGVLGLEGPFFGDKLRARFEAGYESWDSDDDGLTADENDFDGMCGLARLAYSPWDTDRKTTFQLEYERSLDFSAISNYNRMHTATLSVLHAWIPDRLDSDASVSFGTTMPSDGPKRKMLEAGVGFVYHLYKQADLGLRYLYRHQTSTNEIYNTSAFADGSSLYQYVIESDGDFFQNIVELSLSLHF